MDNTHTNIMIWKMYRKKKQHKIEYTYPPCEALDMERVNIEFVYPSQLHESV